MRFGQGPAEERIFAKDIEIEVVEAIPSVADRNVEEYSCKVIDATNEIFVGK